jgi:hypothetical protein
MFVKGEKEKRMSNMRRLFQILMIQCLVVFLAQSGEATEPGAKGTTVAPGPSATEAAPPTKQAPMSCPVYGVVTGAGQVAVYPKCPPVSVSNETRAIRAAQRAALNKAHTCPAQCPNQTMLGWTLTSVGCVLPDGEYVSARGSYEYQCDK